MFFLFFARVCVCVRRVFFSRINLVRSRFTPNTTKYPENATPPASHAPFVSLARRKALGGTLDSTCSMPLPLRGMCDTASGMANISSACLQSECVYATRNEGIAKENRSTHSGVDESCLARYLGYFAVARHRANRRATRGESAFHSKSSFEPGSVLPTPRCLQRALPSRFGNKLKSVDEGPWWA